MNKALFGYLKSQLKVHARSLSVQGVLLQIQNVDEKMSNTIHHNWKLDDELLKLGWTFYQQTSPYIFGIVIMTQGVNSVINVLKVWHICWMDVMQSLEIFTVKNTIE